ncbi:polysaccharide lyase 8 family protein [Streptococcus merionis]|uniref:polysaccharide lyase 8 family protein n=1 Tax=Streptococcus merionis TaxID=400065 RepID=UPI0026E9A04C|nr:polysaccharide lyase 8 family protein [Streptococcus merionis]
MKKNTTFLSKRTFLFSSLILGLAILSSSHPTFAAETTTIDPTTTISSQSTLAPTTTENPTTTSHTTEVPKSVQPEEPVSITKDNYTAMLDTWNDINAGNRFYDPNNPAMVEFNKKLEAAVDADIAIYNSNPDRTFLWEDKGDYSKSANITATYRKLEAIAKQITNPASKHYQSEKAIALVKDGMAFLYEKVYNENTEYRQIKGDRSINWWDYEIGTPRAINNTLSLLYEYFTQEDILKYTQPIEKFVPVPTHFRYTSTNPDFPKFEAASGNMTDMGRVKIIAGILRKDREEIAATIRAIEKVFVFVEDGNGFYEDGSHLDHANNIRKGTAYNGAYGNVLIDGLSQLIPVIQKTETPLSPEKMDIIYHWIDNAFLPLMLHGEMADMVRGRAISRPNAEAHVAAVETLRGILRIANSSDDARSLAVKARIKNIVLEGNPFYSVYGNLTTYKDIKNMQDLLNDPAIPANKPDSYIKTYNNMDKLVVYNAKRDFGFALSMFSERTLNFEAMNDENLRGWYTGDGMFYLYNNDLGHYSGNYWPTVDAYKMPGTTETDAKRIDGTAKNISEQADQVGMYSLPAGSFVQSKKLDDAHAMAAMTFTNWNKTLTLNKGWFVLDDKIVFVGSNIQNTSNDKVSTTIDQRKVDPAHSYKVYVNGTEKPAQENFQSGGDKTFAETKSIFLESDENGRNIGYIFFKPSDITISQQIQTGQWNKIKGYGKPDSRADAEHSNEYITISQAHTGKGDSYGYILLPNVSRQEFEAVVNNLNLELLENNDKMTVVNDLTNKRRLVIKYNNQESKVDDQVLNQAGFYEFANPEDKPAPQTTTAATTTTNMTTILRETATTSAHTTKKKTKNVLPQTGTRANLYGLVGLGLLTIAGMMHQFLRKKADQ